MRKRYFILIILAFFCKMLEAQPTQDSLRLDPVFRVDMQASVLELDAFNTLYIADKKGVLTQFDSLGQQRYYHFSDNRLGVPDVLDVTNPLKTLVFYKNYQQCVVLDRTLSQTGTLDFAALGLGWISALCTAQDGGIWVFDQNSFSLKKINQNGNVQYESQTLNQLLQQSVIIEELQAEEGRVMAWDAAGLYVFDNFGQYLGFYAKENLIALLFNKQGLLWADDFKIEWLNRFYEPIKTWIIPQKKGKANLFLEQKRLIYQTEEGLEVFKF